MKVLVADDHAVVRAGIKRILEKAHEPVQVGEASTGQEVLQKVRASKWDLLLLDVEFPDCSGFDVLKRLAARTQTGPRVLMLTIHDEQQYAVRALRAGAAGFLSKQCAPEQLVTAVRKVARGGCYLSAALAETLAFERVGGDPEQPLHACLSDREFQVLCSLAAGQSLTEIARTLGISVKTISTHRTRMLAKMRMKSTAELIRYALRHRLAH
ncbi:MAG: response regulator transcription factor [Deltaproteobacteria bacterium]|nr:response regulator transcription factor [Deltaproteobacteria bacterium]